MSGHNIYAFSFQAMYRLYLAKVTKKGRSEAELQAVIAWLTGYAPEALASLDGALNLEQFFAQAPSKNPKRSLITGSVCGVSVASITEPLMKEIRLLDKLVDELAKGKPLEKILRA